MGITIHYTIIADGYGQVLAAVRVAEDAARNAGWSYTHVKEKGRLTFSRFLLSGLTRFNNCLEWLRTRYREVAVGVEPLERMEGPPFAYIWMTREGYGYAYPEFSYGDGEDEIEGIVIDSGVTESFALLFYRIGRYYFCSGFTKTQPFTEDEVETCTRFHIFICRVLKTIQEQVRPWHIYVADEGKFYEAGDINNLLEAFGANSRIIWSLSTALQRVFNESGIPAKALVGGRHEVKPYEPPIGEPDEDEIGDGDEDIAARLARELRRPTGRQTTLDEFGGGVDG